MHNVIARIARDQPECELGWMRATLIILHRWTALVVGVILLGTAASGASLVFEGAIDRGLHPELWTAPPSGALLSIDTMVARVEA